MLRGLLSATRHVEKFAGELLQNIEEFAGALEVWFDSQALLRCNVATVGGSEALIAHYIEGELREVMGEARGCVGWPDKVRIKKVKGWLTGLCGSFETTRRKWCTEEDGREAHRQQFTAEVAMHCPDRIRPPLGAPCPHPLTQVGMRAIVPRTSGSPGGRAAAEAGRPRPWI